MELEKVRKLWEVEVMTEQWEVLEGVEVEVVMEF